MNRVLVLLQIITGAVLRMAQALRIAYPNRLHVAPFYGVSRMPDVCLPKRIPVSGVALHRIH